MPSTNTNPVESASLWLAESAGTAPLPEPFLPCLLRATNNSTETRSRTECLLDFWRTRTLGGPIGRDRYRWELSHGTQLPPYSLPVASWLAWRFAEQDLLVRAPREFVDHLTLTPILCESVEFLSELGDERALGFLSEVDGRLRRDFALFVQARHSFADTFALWNLGQSPLALRRLHPIALAILENYSALARATDGVVRGLRFPFHEKPLVSASAQLASALLVLGCHLDLASQLLSFVVHSERAGCWGEAGGKPDLLTSLTSARLRLLTDPDFDSTCTLEFFAQHQHQAGFWRLLGPEVPWLTTQVRSLFLCAQLSFAERFRFPYVSPVNLDAKTQLPFFAYFIDLARLFSSLSGLAQCRVEIAFVDLAGFREFNNRFGQQCGDEVLESFGGQLAKIPHAVAIRDGGDEFLVVGAPTGNGLAEAMDRLRHGWPTVFHQRFGTDVPVVAPRILATATDGRSLRETRQMLGQSVAPLKKRATSPEPTGVLEWIGD